MVPVVCGCRLDSSEVTVVVFVKLYKTLLESSLDGSIITTMLCRLAMSKASVMNLS